MMKHLYLMIFLLSLLVVSTHPAAYAGKEGDVGNGGETVTIQGQEWLRDLVDTAVCRFESGEQFTRRIASFDAMLRPLGELHSVLEQAIREETSNVKVCLTRGALKPIPTDAGDIFAPYRFDGNQIAIRVRVPNDKMDTVFINTTLFGSMPEGQKPYLWLHELMHSMIPQGSPLRMLKLRSFVAAVYDLSEQPMNRDELKLLVQESSISLPQLDAALALHVIEGRLDRVKEALFYGANPLRARALSFAAFFGQTEIFKELLKSVDDSQLKYSSGGPLYIGNEEFKHVYSDFGFYQGSRRVKILQPSSIGYADGWIHHDPQTGLIDEEYSKIFFGSISASPGLYTSSSPGSQHAMNVSSRKRLAPGYGRWGFSVSAGLEALLIANAVEGNRIEILKALLAVSDLGVNESINRFSDMSKFDPLYEPENRLFLLVHLIRRGDYEAAKLVVVMRSDLSKDHLARALVAAQKTSDVELVELIRGKLQ